MGGPPLSSLVKYDTPSLLTTKDKKGAKGAKTSSKKLPPVEGKPQLTQTEDILNSILPPRCAPVPGEQEPVAFGCLCFLCAEPPQLIGCFNSPQGVDRRRAALGAVCVEYTVDTVSVHRLTVKAAIFQRRIELVIPVVQGNIAALPRIASRLCMLHGCMLL